MSTATRSRRSDTLSVQLVADCRLATSADTVRADLQRLAKKYSVSVRPGASEKTIREQLRRHFSSSGVEATADPAAAPAADPPSSPVPHASDASSSLSCTIASQLHTDPQQQPAAQQRLQHGPEPLASASQHPSESGTHVSSSSRSPSHAELASLLMRVRAAEDEAARLRAQASASDADRVRIVVQVTEVVNLTVQVVEAPTASSGAAQPAFPKPTVAPGEPHAQAISRAAPPTPASGPAAAAAPPPHSSQQQQQPAPAPQSLDWVISGLDFAAGSSRDAAHAAVADFATESLGMADAAPLITVLRVSGHRDGLAVIRLAGRSAERAMRSAKALLPHDCRVSIYRSLPPEQRGAAAQLRLARRSEQHLTPQEVATARHAAKAALDFARRRLADQRRSPSHRAFRPPPVAVPLGVPSFFSVLHDESASTASPGAQAPAEGFTPPTAVAAAEPTTTMPAAARIDVC